MSRLLQKIGVLGAGAWGTALALAAVSAGRDVVLWGRHPQSMSEMQRMRSNAQHLPGLSFPDRLNASHSLSDLASCDILLAVIPAQHLGAALTQMKPDLPHVPVVICAKGIDLATGHFLSDHLRAILPHHTIGVLSGPGFAQDVASGLPTAVSLAFENEVLAFDIAAALSSPQFRLYSGSDVRGVEIGGALKNVFAIAAGIVVGRGLGTSARAALISRSFAEMQRFGAANGARPETFSGLSGLGDLVLSATSEQSRNLRFGIALGRGGDAQSAQNMLGTVEGIATTHATLKHAAAQNVDMPVTQAVANIINGAESVDDAVRRLLNRPLKAEH